MIINTLQSLDKWVAIPLAVAMACFLAIVLILLVKWKYILKTRKRIIKANRYLLLIVSTAILQSMLIFVIFQVINFTHLPIGVMEFMGRYINAYEPYLSITCSIIMAILVVIAADILTYSWKKRSVLAFVLCSSASLVIMSFVYNDIYSGYFFNPHSGQAMSYHIKTLDGYVLGAKPGKDPDLECEYLPINARVKSDIAFFMKQGKHKTLPAEPSWYSIDPYGEYFLYFLPGKDPKTGVYLKRLDQEAMDKMILSTRKRINWDDNKVFLAMQRMNQRREKTLLAKAKAEQELVDKLEAKKRELVDKRVAKKAEEERLEAERRRKALLARQKALAEKERQEELQRKARIQGNIKLLIDGRMSISWVEKNTENLLKNSNSIEIEKWFKKSHSAELFYFSEYQNLLLVGFEVRSLKNYARVDDFYDKSAKRVFQLFDKFGGIYYPRSTLKDNRKDRLRKGERIKLIAVFTERAADISAYKNGTFAIMKKDAKAPYKLK